MAATLHELSGNQSSRKATAKRNLKANVIDALRCHYESEADIPRAIRLHYVKDQAITYA